MNIGSIIARCLTILAIVGMIAVQTSGPAAANAAASSGAGASMAAMVMDGTPTAMTGMGDCPGGRHLPADCGKGCPWAVLCMPSFAEIGRSPELASIASSLVPVRVPADDAIVAPWSDGPPARPPRT